MFVGLVEWHLGEPAVFTHDDMPGLMRTLAEHMVQYVEEEDQDTLPELDLEDHESVKDWLTEANEIDDWALVTIYKPGEPGSRAQWTPHTKPYVKDGQYVTYNEMVSLNDPCGG
jgi:hypothetical protein